MIHDPQVLPSQIEKELCIQETKRFSDKKGGWCFNKDLNECVKDSDAIIFLTAWDEYKGLNFKKFSQLMENHHGFLILER